MTPDIYPAVKPKRRWYQFGLRGLLIGTAVVAVLIVVGFFLRIRLVGTQHGNTQMAAERRFKTIGEIIGLNKDGTPKGDVFQIYLDLDVHDDEELKELPEHAQNIWFIYQFSEAVDNGGMDQFICSFTGAYAAQTLRALEAAGARHHFEWLRQACNLFPNGLPDKDQDVRRRQYTEVVAAHRINFEPVKLGELLAAANPGSKVDKEDLALLALTYWKLHTQEQRP